MSSDYKLEPSYNGVPPVKAVAAHAAQNPAKKSRFKLGLWMASHSAGAYFVLLFERDGKVVPAGCDDDVLLRGMEDCTTTPCHPNGWPLSAVQRDEHSAAVEAAYREGYQDRGERVRDNFTRDWLQSNARAILEPQPPMTRADEAEEDGRRG